jgi:hypothetical protein
VSRGKKNIYICQSRGHQTVTIDREDGVTPFMIRCRFPDCTSMAESSFYRVDQTLEAFHEWYRPDAAERAKLHPATLEHVERGGLLLRPIYRPKDKAEKRRGVRAQRKPRGERP